MKENDELLQKTKLRTLAGRRAFLLRQLARRELKEYVNRQAGKQAAE